MGGYPSYVGRYSSLIPGAGYNPRSESSYAYPFDVSLPVIKVVLSRNQCPPLRTLRKCAQDLLYVGLSVVGVASN